MENGTMRLNTFYLFDSKGTNISSHDEDDFNGWKSLISKKKEDHTIWIEEYGKFSPIKTQFLQDYSKKNISKV